MTARLLGFSLVLVLGCDRRVDHARTEQAAPPAQPPPAAPAVHVAAIGDLHGDLDAARRAFRLAGAIDANDAWIGGPLVVVQTGDEIDRGDDDRKILDWTEKLREPARAAGGQVVLLAGNHEVMNVGLDFRYVTPGGFAAFADVPARPELPLANLAMNQRGRATAFAPGGTYAKLLAARPIWAKVGDSVFVHGGILPKHVAYGLDKLQGEVSAWMRGERAEPPAILLAEDGPIWTRSYSSPGKEDCASLASALGSLGARRMVVGHTPQEHGISSACEGQIFRIDVGMSKFYGGPVQVLDISPAGAVPKKE
jgi:hypothetical protein